MSQAPDHPAEYYTLTQLISYYRKLATSVGSWETWLRDHEDPGVHDVFMLRCQVESIVDALSNVYAMVATSYDRIPIDNLACRQGEERWLVTRKGTLRGAQMKAAMAAAARFGRPDGHTDS